MRIILLIIIFLFPVAGAYASATRSIDADQITSSSKVYTFLLPAQSGNVMISAGIIKEVPSGTVNGSNTAFVLSSTPLVSGTVQVYLDGVLQDLTSDYTFATATVTFVSAPVVGQKPVVIYSKY